MPKISLPATKLGRVVVGVALIIGGVLGFLPIVGFWMIPLGLLILSHDFPAVRRFRRKWTVRLMRLWHKHAPGKLTGFVGKMMPGNRQRKDYT